MLFLVPEINRLTGLSWGDSDKLAFFTVVLLRLVWTAAELIVVAIVYWLPNQGVNLVIEDWCCSIASAIRRVLHCREGEHTPDRGCGAAQYGTSKKASKRSRLKQLLRLPDLNPVEERSSELARSRKFRKNRMGMPSMNSSLVIVPSPALDPFNESVVLRYRFFLEQRKSSKAPSTINVR